jgi:hypothetical protein
MKGKSNNCSTKREEEEKNRLYNLYFKDAEQEMNEEERELFRYIVDTFGPQSGKKDTDIPK